MRDRVGYIAIAAALLLIEIGIAAFVHDRFVRSHLGDMLAVMLAYAGFRTIGLRLTPALVAALALATAIEFGQKWGLLAALGLAANPIARIVLGTGFDPTDFLAYAAGGVAVVALEALRRHRR